MSNSEGNGGQKAKFKVLYAPLDPNPNPSFNLVRSTPEISPRISPTLSPVEKGKDIMDDFPKDNRSSTRLDKSKFKSLYAEYLSTLPDRPTKEPQNVKSDIAQDLKREGQKHGEKSKKFKPQPQTEDSNPRHGAKQEKRKFRNKSLTIDSPTSTESIVDTFSPLEKAHHEFDRAFGEIVESPGSRPISSTNTTPTVKAIVKKKPKKRFNSEDFEKESMNQSPVEQKTLTRDDKIDLARMKRIDSEETVLLKEIQKDNHVKRNFSMANLSDPTSFKLRIGTFNVENLYARYKFGKLAKQDCPIKGFTLDTIVQDGFVDKPAKQLTAYCIQDMNADVLALQEIEGMQLLERFNQAFLQDMGYKYIMVIDGHDPRQIEVGILSRFPIEYVRSNRHIRSETTGDFLFPRDCLEVTIRIGSKLLVCYVSHLTSMALGREKSFARRSEQALKICDILDQRWRSSMYKGDYIVMGDFNDYYDNTSAVKPLVTHQALENVALRLPKKDQWTHYYNKEGLYSQLDYILVSKTLAFKNKETKPQIWRKGLPYRVEAYQGPRYSGVGMDRPKASDHCPMSMDLVL